MRRVSSNLGSSFSYMQGLEQLLKLKYEVIGTYKKMKVSITTLIFSSLV
jgi:hypothetical protein